jgi:hypothetical protein
MTNYVDLIPSLCTTRRNTCGMPVLFVDADASKEEKGTARIVDHARDLCPWARVNDAEFEVVEGDRSGAKCSTTAGCGGADSASTTTIQSSNDNLMAVGSNLGLTGLDLGPAIFLNDFLCRLITGDTKNRLFLYRTVGICYSSHHPK